MLQTDNHSFLRRVLRTGELQSDGARRVLPLALTCTLYVKRSEKSETPHNSGGAEAGYKANDSSNLNECQNLKFHPLLSIPRREHGLLPGALVVAAA